MADVKTQVHPSGRQGQIAKGTNLLKAARQLGVDIDSVWRPGNVRRCQIDIGEGQFAKHGISSSADALSPPSASEARYAEKRDLKPGGGWPASARLNMTLWLMCRPPARCITSLSARQLITGRLNCARLCSCVLLRFVSLICMNHQAICAALLKLLKGNGQTVCPGR